MSGVVLVDYGIGNLRSIEAALEFIGFKASIDSDGSQLRRCSVAIVPGVARFGSAMRALNQTGQARELIRAHSEGRHLLGLCLGAQLFLHASDESPGVGGLGLVDGQVRQLTPVGRPLPNQTWHRVDCRLALSGTHLECSWWCGTHFYFSHSYRVDLGNEVSIEGQIPYGGETVTALYQEENVTGIQFHPELSGDAGLTLLQRVVREGRI